MVGPLALGPLAAAEKLLGSSAQLLAHLAELGRLDMPEAAKTTAEWVDWTPNVL